jgi:erythromycin esterase-like protein
LKSLRLALLVPLVILLGAPALRAEGGPGSPLGPGLWRLAGADPTLPQDDLEPLRHILAGAQIVGLGESFHTTGGEYRMKDRVFRFLVERMGYRALGMETSWRRAERVESYVQTCQGPIGTALRGVSSVWQSTEVQDMVQWMCEWNAAHPGDRVHFYGFDIQAQSDQDGADLIAFLGRLGIGGQDPRVAGIRACDGVETDYFLEDLPYPPELYTQCQAALAGVAAYFDGERKAIEKRTSLEDLAWARVSLVGQQAWQEEAFYLFDDGVRSALARDRGMAEVAQAIRGLRFPHARTALWAHNGHIAKNGATAYLGTDMGTHLAADLGHKYQAIGLGAHETYLDWAPARRCGLFPFPVGPGSLEGLFHDLGAGAGALADLGAHPPLLAPGAAYTFGGSGAVIPGDHFDAVIYLEVSPAMHPLAWLPCH